MVSSLAQYRWHTGATLLPLAPDERCPVLFRDVGLSATLRFLRAGLSRLAGPLTPITYMRTHAYQEPYVDYEATGRLVLLNPIALGVWHSGLPHIYVADARKVAAPGAVAWVPGNIALAEAARLLDGARDDREVREAFGGITHDRAAAGARERLQASVREAEETEREAEPLRRALTSRDDVVRARARESMERAGISELDLCAAWNHVAPERRAFLRSALKELR